MRFSGSGVFQQYPDEATKDLLALKVCILTWINDNQRILPVTSEAAKFAMSRQQEMQRHV